MLNLVYYFRMFIVFYLINNNYIEQVVQFI